MRTIGILTTILCAAAAFATKTVVAEIPGIRRYMRMRSM